MEVEEEPFVSGCLYNQFNNEAEKSKMIAIFLQEKSERENRSFKKRVCNSYDGYFGSASSLAMPPTDVCIELLIEEYTEICILSQNWESAMFSAWVMQIVLSEIMGVLASIESSGPGRNLNFYVSACANFSANGSDPLKLSSFCFGK